MVKFVKFYECSLGCSMNHAAQNELVE